VRLIGFLIRNDSQNVYKMYQFTTESSVNTYQAVRDIRETEWLKFNRFSANSIVMVNIVNYFNVLLNEAVSS